MTSVTEYLEYAETLTEKEATAVVGNINHLLVSESQEPDTTNKYD